jgi:polysaccharide pyruvyl transferase WcaK-like protein
MESDFIGDIWAGDSFSDIYGTLRLLIGALPKLVIYLLGRKVVFLPQTYGPFRSFLGRRLAWLLLRHADLIMIRDRLSIPVIRRVSGRYFDPQKLRFCPDVAFIMGSTDGVRSELEQELTGRQVDRVGLNISGLLYLKSGSGGKRFSLRFDYRRFVRILMEGLLGEDRTEIILVPHTYTIDPNDRGENDYAASLEALSQLPVEARAKVHLIRRECDQFEIKGAIGACDFFIGSRLHACIAAISQGIPTIGVAYSRKFSGIFASVGMSMQTIDIRQVGLRETVDRILDMYRHRFMLRRDISSRAAEIPLMIQREFAKLLETHLAATRQA